eukprot:GHVU01133267.1.p1 GENE.GHVU01133267.1~~GHVU01133267.1.p1  ORF type:complete len:255 (+),score=16.88 GHVU01133267.1:823-1587(+)
MNEGREFIQAAGRTQSSTRGSRQTPGPDESERRNSFAGMNTPRRGEDDDMNCEPPIPVFGSQGGSQRPAREVFPGAPMHLQQATGGTRNNPWSVSDERMPATERSADWFSHLRQRGSSTYRPVRADTPISPPRAQPYDFIPTRTTTTFPPLYAPANLTDRSPTEQRSASHSANTAVRSPSRDQTSVPRHNMEDLKKAIQYVQQQENAMRTDSSLLPDLTSSSPRSHLTSTWHAPHGILHPIWLIQIQGYALRIV